MENDAEFEELLNAVEEKLRARARTALEEGRYASVRKIVELLDRLLEASNVAIEGLTEEPGDTEKPSATGSASASSKEAETRSVVVVDERTEEPEEEYPSYVRDPDHLVKVGWSKKRGEEYRHRAPEESVRAICERIGSVARKQRCFERDDLEGISSDGTSVPDYQVYVCLGWLRWTGLVNRHARGQYSVPNLNDFENLVDTAWRQLPETQ